jgi:hypothetical protein
MMVSVSVVSGVPCEMVKVIGVPTPPMSEKDNTSGGAKNDVAVPASVPSVAP